MAGNLTLEETARSLHLALRDYIEATYHIGDQRLIDQRQALLDQIGVIRQVTHIESTPRYISSPPFRELGLPKAALEVLTSASSGGGATPLVNDPPYQHQADSLRQLLINNGSAIVTTGTGSGKTECFLFPILGRLAMQADSTPESFAEPAVRALVLYPMNALVNDQLGRLRLLFGSNVVSKWFTQRAGRPARFARYTSRTLYPGVRTSKRDSERLKPLDTYYLEHAKKAGVAGPDGESSRKLVGELSSRGKWPAKPDLIGWYGRPGSHWADGSGKFRRAITLPDDPELLTRHEVLAAPPDILVTNYSMLEYMLMRPLEKRLFDVTREWYARHGNERLLVVVDEAHLYRGAAGAEVALLLRRLRDRLGIDADRLQIICTTASFDKPEEAPLFASRLTGVPASQIASIRGDLALHPDAGPGDDQGAQVLAAIDIDAFYGSEESGRIAPIENFLRSRGVEGHDPSTALFAALKTFRPMKLLVNETMQGAKPVGELSRSIFPATPPATAERATTALVALGSYAREPGKPNGPGLLPSRLHAFFRGLPGLWACADQDCTALDPSLRGGPTGKLYAQPIDRCACGARVFELYTCRNCGSAYFRAYTNNLEAPGFLWTTRGETFSGTTDEVRELSPIDVFLGETGIGRSAQPADLDITTGRLNPRELTGRIRSVSLPPPTTDAETVYGEFNPCVVCDLNAPGGKTSVQDHQTKGDEPFRALVARQVEVQPQTTEPSAFAPLGGRKVLVFSDSRQAAARLAPNLQKYTTRDAVRPLLIYGYDLLQRDGAVGPRVSLEETYLAILLGMARLGVRLRPPMRARDVFDNDVAFVARGIASASPDLVGLLIDMRARNPPEAVLEAVQSVVNDQYYGLRSLALGTIEPRDTTIMDRLPSIEGLAKSVDEKGSVVGAWLSAWRGQWVRGTPDSWMGKHVKVDSGRFPTKLRHLIAGSPLRKAFEREWLPILLGELTDPMGDGYRLKGAALTLNLAGPWGYCQVCRSTHRPIAGREDLCITCGSSSLKRVDPDQDAVFVARKGYYRRTTVQALRNGVPPLALIAAEHTAQLNEAQADAVFSEAEENELLFQDVNLGDGKPAIDVLSCTTTMEVGIDIGALSGVALRNMPPSRANYQQRSGRAGRRGRAVATVTAFAGGHSHDEHGFSEPDGLIRGKVIDPEMPLDNWEIAKRHLLAFVLQEYVGSRLTAPDPSASGTLTPTLFEVLGTVDSFLDPTSTLSLDDFSAYVAAHRDELAARAASWLPPDLQSDAGSPSISGEIEDMPRIIKTAVTDSVRVSPLEAAAGASDETEDTDGTPELPAEEGESAPGAQGDTGKLLTRLLYKGVLPRYAFPTDVASFYVFDVDRSRPFRPAFLYSPSQGMEVALSTYAPGKRVWIGNREWTSGAIYSRVQGERFEAWDSRRLYLECSVCHFAKTIRLSEGERGETSDCPACGTTGGLGPAQTWLRPPGFAHPWFTTESVSPDDDPPTSYATRAKLTVPTPVDPTGQQRVNDRIGVYFGRLPLLVTNRGPEAEGYTYCTKCGLIEPATIPASGIVAGHQKPFPDERDQVCPGSGTARAVVLGTDFISDVLIISLRVDPPLTLKPQYESSRVILRTLSEALTIQALRSLSLTEGELLAEFRPALTAGGKAGTEAEIYMYDTLPGGAGFAQRAGGLGISLFDKTLELLESCPADCSASCYRCLRSFKNQFDHGLLDRHLAASVLRHFLTGETPALPASRVEDSTDTLFQDLQSQRLPDLALERAVPMTITRFGTLTAPILARRGERRVVVVLQHPAGPGTLLDPQWEGPAEFGFSPEVRAVDELAVRRNLPWASASVMESLGY